MKDDKVSVRVGTGSVDTVDDVVRKPGAATKQPQTKQTTTTTETITQPDNPPATVTPLDLLTSTPPLTSIKTNPKKRKSAELEEDEETSEYEIQGGGKKPRTEEHTSTIPSLMGEFLDSNLPTIPPNLPLPLASDVPMAKTHAAQGEADSEDDEDESEDDGGDDNSDYMRVRKLSMIEIKITLVRP